MVRKVRQGKANQVRIIGGSWRRRLLPFPDIPDLRPTPDRVRETLFNWLQNDLAGLRCLDGFAGSGALGLEALSRGADSVIAIEQHPSLIDQLRQNAKTLGANGMDIRSGVFEKVIPSLAGESFDLVFLDPPFAKDRVLPSLALLENHHCLSEDALIYVETELASPAWPENFQCYKQSKAGSVHFFLLQYDA